MRRGCLSAQGVSTDRWLRSLRQAQDKRCSTSKDVAVRVVSTGSASVGCGCLPAYGVSTDRSLRSLLDQQVGPSLRSLRQAQDKRCSTSRVGVVSTGSASVGCGCLPAYGVSTDRSLRSLRQAQDKRCSTSKDVRRTSGFDRLTSVGCGCLPAYGVSTDRSLRSLLDQQVGPSLRSLRQAQDKRCSTSSGSAYGLVSTGSTSVGCGCFRRYGVSTDRSLRSLLDQQVGPRFAPFDRLRTGAARPAGGLVSTGSTSVGCGCLSAHGVSTDRSLRSLLDQQPGRSLRLGSGQALLDPPFGCSLRQAQATALLDRPTGWGIGCLRWGHG